MRGTTTERTDAGKGPTDAAASVPGDPSGEPSGQPAQGAVVTDDAVVGAPDALAELWRDHYADLVRLARFLVDDRETAEEVVQDAFVRLHGRLHAVAPEKAAGYLRVAVLNGSRSNLRRRKVARAHPAPADPPSDPAEAGGVGRASRDEVIAIVRALPRRQRDVVLLRYFADLPEAAVAETLGISTGSVKTHNHRALLALRGLLEDHR